MNNNTSTPETDARVTTFESISKRKKRFTLATGKVSAEFARQLELQRDEARQSAAYWRDVATGTFARSATLPWEDVK